VRCFDCDIEIDPHTLTVFLHQQCVARNRQRAPARALRDWAQRQKTLGRISAETFEELERCAADIEAGWPR